MTGDVDRYRSPHPERSAARPLRTAAPSMPGEPPNPR